MRFFTKVALFLTLFSTTIVAQDSLNMTLLSTFDPSGNSYNDVWAYTTETGEEYAVIGNATRIYVVDVTDCSNPVEVFSYVGGNSTTWRDFKTFGDYMYAVCDGCSEGLHVFDMSALPGGMVTHELTTTAFFGSAHNIYIEEDSMRLYAVGFGGSGKDITILDLSVTPESPTLLADVDFNSLPGVSGSHYIHDIYVKGDTAYASHGNIDALKVWNMNDVGTPVELGFVDTGNYNHSSWVTPDGKYCYYAEEVPKELPMGVIDLTPVQTGVGTLDTVRTFRHRVPSATSGWPTPHNPYVHNDMLYVSHYEDGVKIFDLTDKENPVIEGYYDTYTDNGSTYGGYNGCWGVYPYLESGCILASDRKYGLNVLRYEVPPPPLPPCDSVTSYLTNPLFSGNFTQFASDSILIDGRVSNTSNYHLEAENSVNLDGGFDTGVGQFEAAIGPCDPGPGPNPIAVPKEEEIKIKK